MNVDQFIANLKRRTQYGNPATPADQAAKDILASINSGLDRIALNWMWDWLYDGFTITLATGVENYTLDGAIRKIAALYAGDNAEVTNISVKEYARIKAGGDGPALWYVYYGRSSGGARKVKIGGFDSSITTLSGLGKLKLTRFQDTDLGTAASMLPFPEEGEMVLQEFVLADIYELQGKKDLIYPKKNEAEAELKAWRGEETTEPANNATSKLPEYLRNKLANRRNGYVV